MANLISNPQAVMISDLHVGDPQNKQLEDFDRDDDFERLLTKVIPEKVGWPATLIIAGDFIDFPQVLPELGKHDFGDRLGATEDESVRKLKRVIEGHPKVFNAIKKYLELDGSQILILPGNHDIDLHWPDVLSELRGAVGGPGSPQFHFVKEGKISEQRIYIEHGNQYSYDNRFEFWETPFLKDSWNRLRIERPWGTFFMDMVYNDVETMYPFVNKIYPHSRFATLAIVNFFKGELNIGKSIARLVFFLLIKGKRFGLGRLLGPEDEEVSTASVEEFLLDLGADPRDPRFAEVVSETSKLIEADSRSTITSDTRGTSIDSSDMVEAFTASQPSEDGVDSEGLLGRTDERGMEDRQIELWKPGGIDLIAFGHTHLAIDGNKHPQFGLNSPRRAFNTGSWMPTIPIGEYESPKWGELASMPRTHDVRYLAIELGNHPKGRLELLS